MPARSGVAHPTSPLVIPMNLLAKAAALLCLATSAASQSVCNPVVQIDRMPCLGEWFTLTTTSSPTCMGCTMFSFQPGPTPVSGIIVPLGMPADFLYAGVGRSSMTLRVPFNPDFLELDVIFAAVVADGTVIEASAPLTVRACP